MEIRDRKASRARRERHIISKWARAGSRRRSGRMALRELIKEARSPGR